MTDNKALVARFFELLSSGDVDDAFLLVAEDAEWTIPESLSPAPVHRDAVRERAKVMHELSRGSFRQWVVSMTAEDDRVAVEARSSASFASGAEYRNRYHFLFVVRDGRIAGVRAYSDTWHVKEVLFAEMAPHPEADH
jgi:ketosteroid isomerase-like protein